MLQTTLAAGGTVACVLLLVSDARRASTSLLRKENDEHADVISEIPIVVEPSSTSWHGVMRFPRQHRLVNAGFGKFGQGVELSHQLATPLIPTAVVDSQRREAADAQMHDLLAPPSAPQQSQWLAFYDHPKWPASGPTGAPIDNTAPLNTDSTGVDHPIKQLRRERLGMIDRGVPWAMPVAQGYPGEQELGGPFVPSEMTSDVLETENEARKSTESRFPYVKYYGQPTNFMEEAELDPRLYDYVDGFESNAFDLGSDQYLSS